MPTYEFRCKECGKTHEVTQGFNDPRPTTCPACGGQLARVFHPVGVVFKGSGFHKTDYAAPGAKPATTETSGGSTDGPPGKTESTPGKAAEPSKTEAKPAAPATPAPKTDTKKTDSS